ncbi:hypothetical protein [Pedobacter endophyticus]|uniref:Uncharacterized protein n=1 Tax=Pedobacter endophyticus TaxID=2789740 RepID=A0A7S9PZM1_9SPHI|nr:hypothetical protein [Pedobacter endophyticus]QPH40085.1 hypothetical protein IZT61_02015 [Pedobacter endophyticus]
MYPYNNIDIYPHSSGLCVTETTGTAANSLLPEKAVGLSGELSLAVERLFRQSVPFPGAEQAEVGQWPYLLALSYRYRGFKYPPGILVGLSGR